VTPEALLHDALAPGQLEDPTSATECERLREWEDAVMGNTTPAAGPATTPPPCKHDFCQADTQRVAAEGGMLTQLVDPLHETPSPAHAVFDLTLT
jgi:hypothetical protein